MGEALTYAGAVLIFIWGVAHIIPARAVVDGFGPISTDNRRIITMEWVAEGLALCFIGLLVLISTIADAGATAPVMSAVMLLVMAAWTALTGARTSILPIKVCPFVKTGVAVLFLLGVAL